MAVETVSTNIYTCDYCGTQTTTAPSGWFQVWVINVMEPKHFDTAKCALAMLQAANVAPEVNIIVEDVPAEDRNPEPVNPSPATPDTPPEPATPDTPPEPATPNEPEPLPDPEPVPAPEEPPAIEPEDINPDAAPEDYEEPPLDPEEPQPAE